MTITNLFIIICVLIFIYINLISKGDKMGTLMKIGALYPPKVNEGQYWRLITCNFIHENIIHLVMNMYCIYYLGNYYEMLFGPIYYIGIIIITMLASSLASLIAPMYFPNTKHNVTIGASGIFYGFLGVMIALALYKGGLFYTMLQSYLYMIVINIAVTLFTPGISKSGHFGGLLGGYLYIALLNLMKII